MGSSAARCSSPSGGGCRLRQVREKVRPAPPRANPQPFPSPPHRTKIPREVPFSGLSRGILYHSRSTITASPIPRKYSRHSFTRLPQIRSSAPA